jgi:sucrose-6-phosphate hydrolase SacC (GH32 family)
VVTTGVVVTDISHMVLLMTTMSKTIWEMSVNVELEVQLDPKTEFSLTLAGEKVFSVRGNKYRKPESAKVSENDRIKVRILKDACCYEIFVDDGKHYISMGRLFNPEKRDITIR